MDVNDVNRAACEFELPFLIARSVQAGLTIMLSLIISRFAVDMFDKVSTGTQSVLGLDFAIVRVLAVLQPAGVNLTQLLASPTSPRVGLSSEGAYRRVGAGGRTKNIVYEDTYDVLQAAVLECWDVEGDHIGKACGSDLSCVTQFFMRVHGNVCLVTVFTAVQC